MKQTVTTPTATSQVAPHGTLLSYISGFILSIVLTLAVFFLVNDHVVTGHEAFSHGFLTVAIMSLAVVQLIVQLIFFLHLGNETKPRWNLAVFLFMMVVLIVIVGGSLWIMDNLNYHTKSPQDTSTYIMNDEGIHR